MRHVPNTMAKDYFSGQASLYKAFRPTYPEALYDFILNVSSKKETAWDCATGNGQVAQRLANDFREVYATDISKAQLDKAVAAGNVHYSLQPAEKTTFPEHQFDLITVGQALHWFDLESFYKEVRRVARPGGVLAAWGYAVPHVEPDIDLLIDVFYRKTIGPYWDAARRHIDAHFTTLAFPFREVAVPLFSMEFHWNRAHFLGYLESWSATQQFIRINGYNPVTDLTDGLEPFWPATEVKTISFPLFARVGYT
jgi:SAM-dependent methyltransferase